MPKWIEILMGLAMRIPAYQYVRPFHKKFMAAVRDGKLTDDEIKELTAEFTLLLHTVRNLRK
jgi:hypothetical protein